MHTVNIFRPKDGYELLQALREYRMSEVPNKLAWTAAKAMEDHAGFSFQFKMDKYTAGYATFERFL